MILKCTSCGQTEKFTCAVTQTHQQIVDNRAEVLEDNGDIQDAGQGDYRCFYCHNRATWEAER